MRNYLTSARIGLLPFVVSGVAYNYNSVVHAEEYASSFVKQVEVNEDKRGLVSEEKTLEQCVAQTGKQEYKPQEVCRLNLNEYRVPASGLRGLVGRTQMKLAGSMFVRTRKPERSYGRQELVDVINYAACVMKEVYDAPLEVHDLSREGGGRLRPHKSHRNGKDADVGIYGYDAAGKYYNTTKPMVQRGRLYKDFNNERALEANWLFVDSLIRGPYEVEMIFLDRKLIKGLRLYVVGKYGAQRWEHAGKVLQHEPGHRTHYHIRTKVPVVEPRT